MDFEPDAPRIVVIGGVAGGATAAARARRMTERARITIFEKGPYVSFANCGLPYFVGGELESRSDLLLSNAAMFWRKYAIDVRVQHEVLKIDRERRCVHVRQLAPSSPEQERTFEEPYDALILAPGAAALVPESIPNVHSRNVFVLKTVPDAEAIRLVLDSNNTNNEQAKHTKKAVVVGGGFIGLETAEALMQRGCDVTIVEMLDHILPPFDRDMAQFMEHHLVASGINLVLGDGVKSFHLHPTDPTLVNSVELTSGRLLSDCDLVILSIGVRAETKLAVECGLKLGESTRGILVDSSMRSVSDERIFCVGDAVEVPSLVTGQPGRFQLAGPAQKQGRVAGTNAALLVDPSCSASNNDEGGAKAELSYNGALGTAIVGVLGAVAACTGLSEAACKRAGIQYSVAVTHPLSHVEYIEGARFMHMKVITRRGDCSLLGTQIVGVEGAGVERRIDVVATAIAGRLRCTDMEQLDLAYAPHYGAANDAVVLNSFVASDIHRGEVRVLSAEEYGAQYLGEEEKAGGERHIHKKRPHVLLDVRDRKSFELRHLEHAVCIPLLELRQRLKELPKDQPIITTCKVGMNAYIAYRMLKARGYDVVGVLAGGITTVHARMHPDDPRQCQVEGHHHLS
ncbi:CoA-disulfide reductase [Balamuthia mandrillaris]